MLLTGCKPSENKEESVKEAESVTATTEPTGNNQLSEPRRQRDGNSSSTAIPWQAGEHIKALKTTVGK